MQPQVKTEAQSLPKNLRERALNSLFFTAQALLGLDKLTEYLHYDMCAIAERAEELKRFLGVVPRNHFKSSIWTVAYPLWRGLRDPNSSGLIICNSEKNAQKFLTKIRGMFEKRPLLRSLFPELLPELSERWNMEETTLPRAQARETGTWEAAGWKSRVTSRHYDYIVFDDVVDEETYESPELMAKVTKQFEQRSTGCLVPPIADKLVMAIQNHWSPIDLANHIMEKHPYYYVYYRQAIEDGKPIYPEGYSMKQLLRMQKADPYNFATQYMNDPTSEEVAEMKRAWLQKYERRDKAIELPSQEVIPLGRFNIHAAVDPRHTLATKAAQKMTSRNAISIDGIDAKGRVVHLDEYAHRGGPEELLTAMMRMHKKWRPIKMTIESFGYQAALKPLAEIIWRGEKDKPYLELTKRDTTTSKENRIRGALDCFKLGNGFSHDFMTAFNHEFYTFPNGKTRDVLDCFAWNLASARIPMEDEDFEDDIAHDTEMIAKFQEMGMKHGRTNQNN